MASLLMHLTAVDEGIGARLLGVMPEQPRQFRAEFGAPDEREPIGGITLGYLAADVPLQSGRGKERRRGMEDVVPWGQ